MRRRREFVHAEAQANAAEVEAGKQIEVYMWTGLAEGLENYWGTVESARRQLTKMIYRDNRHLSVIFWSVINECDKQQPEVRGANVVLIHQAKRLDPSWRTSHLEELHREYPGRAHRFGVQVFFYPNREHGGPIKERIIQSGLSAYLFVE